MGEVGGQVVFRRFWRGEWDVEKWAEEWGVEVVSKAPALVGEFDGFEVFLEVDQERIVGGAAGAEGDGLDAIGSVGLGVEIAEEFGELEIIGERGLLVGGELVQEREEVFGVEGGGGSGGECGVCLAVWGEIELGAVGGEIE